MHVQQRTLFKHTKRNEDFGGTGKSSLQQNQGRRRRKVLDLGFEEGKERRDLEKGKRDREMGKTE